MTNEEKKDKTLMSPVVKVEMKEPRKREEEDEEGKCKTRRRGIIIAG